MQSYYNAFCKKIYSFTSVHNFRGGMGMGSGVEGLSVELLTYEHSAVSAAFLAAERAFMVLLSAPQASPIQLVTPM